MLADGKQVALRPLLPYLQPFIETFIPSLDADMATVVTGMEQQLQQRPPALGRQVAALIYLLYYLPCLEGRKPFGKLAPSQRQQFLERLQRSPLKLLRVGLWGLRTLVFLGYYGQPAVQKQIGYRPSRQGWMARVG